MEPTITHTVEDTFILDKDAYADKIEEEVEPCLDTLKSSLRKRSRDNREKLLRHDEPAVPKKSNAKSIFREYSEVTKLNASMSQPNQDILEAVTPIKLNETVQEACGDSS